MSQRHFEYGGWRHSLQHWSADDISYIEGSKAGSFQELPLLEEIRRRGLAGVYVDVGANIGNHSIFFACHCSCAKLVAIEAHPEIFRLLGANVARNSPPCPFVLRNLAVLDSARSAFMSPVPKGNAGRTRVVAKGPTRVFTDTIDNLVAHLDVAVLKLDIEDSEIPAISGALKTLERCRPLLIAEHHNRQLFEDFQAIVEPLGYRAGGRYEPRGETVIWEPSGRNNT